MRISLDKIRRNPSRLADFIDSIDEKPGALFKETVSCMSRTAVDVYRSAIELYIHENRFTSCSRWWAWRSTVIDVSAPTDALPVTSLDSFDMSLIGVARSTQHRPHHSHVDSPVCQAVGGPPPTLLRVPASAAIR